MAQTKRATLVLRVGRGGDDPTPEKNLLSGNLQRCLGRVQQIDNDLAAKKRN